jgi:hypothetical protein
MLKIYQLLKTLYHLIKSVSAGYLQHIVTHYVWLVRI